MLRYIARRVGFMLVMIIGVSMMSFFLVQLPPGDYISRLAAELEASGDPYDMRELERMRVQYGLDRPVHVQYWRWVRGIVTGNMGFSFRTGRLVASEIRERLPYTLVIALGSMVFVWMVSIPVGIYVATHQYAPSDYVVSVFGFLGMATPNFLLAIFLLVVFHRYFGLTIGGLFSPEFETAPWSIARVVDLISHLPIPLIVIGTAGTAGFIRTLRATLLDELRKQYVITARAKGVPGTRLLFRYPVRIALNPMASGLAWLLPSLFSGELTVAIVLGLPTMGPLLFNAVLFQDMYLAGTTTLIMCTLTVIGVFFSDILLAALDPRIRQDK